MKHCVSSYKAMAAEGREAGFCVLRDPLERAVSSYNMYPLLPPRCSPEHLEQEISRTLALGHSDNHDVPQQLYARHCRFVLCFERIEADFGLLLRRATMLVNPRSTMAKSIVTGGSCKAAGLVNATAKGASDVAAACAAAERWSRARRSGSTMDAGPLTWPLAAANNFSGLPRVRPASLGQRRGDNTSAACNVSHLSDRARAALLERYREDFVLRAATCGTAVRVASVQSERSSA
eukprot:5362844-Prymnesium_polylepis.1